MAQRPVLFSVDGSWLCATEYELDGDGDLVPLVLWDVDDQIQQIVNAVLAFHVGPVPRQN